MRQIHQCPVCVAAFVALGRKIPARGKAILERSGLSLIEYDSAEGALAALHGSIRVDALVLDVSRCLERHEEEAMDEMLALAADPPWRDGPLPTIVLTSSGLPLHVRRRCRDQRAQLIARDRFSYRYVGRLIPVLCGCMVFAGPQPVPR
jgi:hypothetical protein